MTITTILTKDEDRGDAFEMAIDGKHAFCAGAGEPEDNTINRDLNFVFRIAGWLKEAHAAGVRGESFVLDAKEQ